MNVDSKFTDRIVSQMEARTKNYFTERLSKDAPATSACQQPDRHVRRLEKLRSHKQNLLSTFVTGPYFTRFAAETFKVFLQEERWPEFYRPDTFKAEIDSAEAEFLGRLVAAGKSGLARAFDEEILRREQGLRSYFRDVQRYAAGLGASNGDPLSDEVVQAVSPDPKSGTQELADAFDGFAG